MLNTYDNFTLNSIFRPKAFMKKSIHFNINYWYWIACFFLFKAFGQNIELRVKLSYGFKFVTYLGHTG